MHESSPSPESENTTGRVADSVDGNWVDRHAPPWSRPYLRLSRADRPIGSWLLLLPCWWSLPLAIMTTSTASILGTIWIALACAIGAILMRGAGCSWNDFADRKLDAEVRRTRSRPLPSGQVTPIHALIWMVIQALLAFALLLTFNPFTIVLGIAALIPVAFYPFAKRVSWWPQIFLGIAFNWGALLAWAAIAGKISPGALLLYAAGIFWTLFYDTIYAHQDREDDGLIGIRSTARLLGAHTKFWLAGFAVAAVLLMVMAITIALIPHTDLKVVLIALGGAIVFGIHLTWQLVKLDISNPDNCLMLFRANRDAGILPVVFFAVAALVA